MNLSTLPPGAIITIVGSMVILTAILVMALLDWEKLEQQWKQLIEQNLDEDEQRE